MVNFFLPVSVEGRDCHSDLQYNKKKNSQGFLERLVRNFSGNYAGIDLFLFIYLFQGVFYRNEKSSDKYAYQNHNEIKYF